MRQLNLYFDPFSIRALPTNPTYEERDAYFLIINGMYGIYDNTVNLSELFVA